MAEHLRQVFDEKGVPETAGIRSIYHCRLSKPQLTVPLMLAMEAGGVDVIELGIPYSEPFADGPTIRETMNNSISSDMFQIRIELRASNSTKHVRQSDQVISFEGRFVYIRHIPAWPYGSQGPSVEFTRGALNANPTTDGSSGGIPIPLVVGFGISTAAHFDYVGRIADGVVVGSKLIQVPHKSSPTPEPSSLIGNRPGRFGGSVANTSPKRSLVAWSHYEYLNRPSQLHLAQRLTAHVGGAKIWFKREDLNQTGSHKINNIGKSRIIAESAAGHHGFATASLCKKFGLECAIYMGADDVERRPDSVLNIKALGAQVVIVSTGDKKIKDAIHEAMGAWASDFESSYYLIGSAIGPSVPDDSAELPKRDRSRDSRATPSESRQVAGRGDSMCGWGKQRDRSIFPFIDEPSVRLVGVEAGGNGLDNEQHSAALTKEDQAGKIFNSRSIAAGLDYPAVGPELASLKEDGRAEFCSATDVELSRNQDLLRVRRDLTCNRNRSCYQ
ncbi:hypothetical protein H4Q26_017112 [Puccinia striiformis f. sp. tritici PST-130]|nr:hypothetical protein H4Q26_017112 [Puccinia striiformis f. sp. tritici PST-130]